MSSVTVASIISSLLLVISLASVTLILLLITPVDVALSGASGVSSIIVDDSEQTTSSLVVTLDSISATVESGTP